MEARKIYSMPAARVSLVRSVESPRFEEEPRMGSGCPTDPFDPNNIASDKLLAMAQQAGIDPSKYPAGAAYGPPSRALREFMSQLVREARNPVVNRDGSRKQQMSLTTISEAEGGPTFNGVQFVFPPGARARIGATLNDDTRAQRLIIQHPASDDGLMIGDGFVSGRNQRFVAGWICADAFDRDTQCPILLDFDIGTPGTRIEFEVLNSNAPATPNLVFTAMVEAVILDKGR